MRDGPTRQRLSGFMFLMVNGRAQPVARVGLWITRARSRVLVLLAILLAAHAGSADAAEGTFIPIDLDTLGGTRSIAHAVNDSGQVAGGREPVAGGGSTHAFLWTAVGGMVDLGSLGGAFSDAAGRPGPPGAINASGQVVGESDTAGGSRHAFSCTAAGGMIDLGTLLGGSRSTATAVNGSGQVVGVGVITDDASSFHAFLWTGAGGMVDLGTLGGTFASATAINASGQVVGSSGASSDNQLLFDAFLWTAAGGMVGLGNLGGVGPV